MDATNNPERNNLNENEDMDAEKSPEISSPNIDENMESEIEIISSSPDREEPSRDENDMSDDCIFVADIINPELSTLNLLPPTAELWKTAQLYDPVSKQIKKEFLETGTINYPESNPQENDEAVPSGNDQNPEEDDENVPSCNDQNPQENDEAVPSGNDQNPEEDDENVPSCNDQNPQENGEDVPSGNDQVIPELPAPSSSFQILPELPASSSFQADRDEREEFEDPFSFFYDDDEMDEADSSSSSEDHIPTVEPMDEDVPEKSPSQDHIPTVERMDEDVPEKSPSEDNFPSEKFVWVKWTGKNYWPAVIIEPSDCGRQSVKDNHAWVFWFGSHKISEMAIKKMTPFIHNFNMFFKRPSKSQLNAVEELIQILAKMSSKIIINREDLVPWAKAGFPGVKLQNDACLNALLKKYLEQDNTDNDETDTEMIKKDKVEDEPSINLFDECQSGNLKIEETCIACNGDLNNHMKKKHPYFDGYVCGSCADSLKETILAVGDDMKNLCCIICGQPGNLIVCEQQHCSKSYCTRCLKSIAGTVRYAEIMKISPWQCFFCLEDNILVKKRIDWEDELLRFLELHHYLPKRPITVLSLFDGIATGKVVLDKLGIEIKKYYACEIDRDAILVSQTNHDGIVYLGNVADINEDTFKDIEELDLVLAGPPCKDLSLANPTRKNLTSPNSTNSLFLHLFRVIGLIKKRYKHCLYLIENVPMNRENRDIISDSLMMEPVLVDALYFSPMSRARLFWGNIPSLKCQAQFWNADPKEALSKYDLNDYMDKTFDRKARVKVLKTVTCQDNSLRLADGSKPVMMNGETDTLTVPELESIFGFPKHYTDAGNISLRRRRALIGQSWSVNVVCAILHPLIYFFLRNF